ncbi:hypothetical protein [Niabella sp.]|uniref:hypothetical protein n=1 Tax=Niabella sp. TaxID=1962976 RepID=UPI0026218648|nr:hypothetical protein [Niabella sp.]
MNENVHCCKSATARFTFFYYQQWAPYNIIKPYTPSSQVVIIINSKKRYSAIGRSINGTMKDPAIQKRGRF